MKGVLVVNLGTPDSPTPAAVGAYLKEFLSDPRVIDLPRWLWLPLLNLVIIPLRRHRSAEAYREVWTPEGSPLLVGSRKLADKLAKALEGHSEVRLAMSYGKPGIPQGLADLRAAGVDELTILPLYPQYSGTTTEAVFDAVASHLRKMEWFPTLESIQKYYDAPGWAPAVADSVRKFQSSAGKPEKLLFSLHGIPQRYVRNGDPYQDQCERSVHDIVEALGLEENEWSLAYQSRVGREPWLQPYMDEVIKELAETGCGHLQVVCPGFAVDCLETLEEIQMQYCSLFLKHGGEKFEYVPALNDRDAHVSVLADLIRNQSPV
jgi:ferrochelatase